MVNAHATSTPEGDPRELEAMRTLFGDRAGQVSITANKSMIGHTLGAAGAIEAIATIMSIRTGIVPPTINLEEPDEAAAGLDLTPGAGAPARDRGRGLQLLRLRRPEQRPRLPALGRVEGATMAEQGKTPGTPAERAPASGAAPGQPAAEAPSLSAEAASLLGLIDKLSSLLEKSDLVELEVQAGETAIVLRKPAALPAAVGCAGAGQSAPDPPIPSEPPRWLSPPSRPPWPGPFARP